MTTTGTTASGTSLEELRRQLAGAEPTDEFDRRLAAARAREEAAAAHRAA